jgi:enoyl-[acyl-carrier protein] reductase I
LAYHAAKAIKREGGRLILTYWPEKTIQYIADIIDELKPAATFCVDWVDASSEYATPTDGAVHSMAGAPISMLTKPVKDLWREEDALTQMMKVSVNTLNHVCSTVRRGCPVVTYSYIGAQRAVPGYNMMGIAKAALESMARYISMEGANRVNVISPGPVPMRAACALDGFSDLCDRSMENAPGYGDPITIRDTVGNLTAFLLSDMSRSICGETIYVDGGLHMMNGA